MRKNAPDQKIQSAAQSQADINTDNSHKIGRYTLMPGKAVNHDTA